jgi:hypothetical protein
MYWLVGLVVEMRIELLVGLDNPVDAADNV